ncbi:phage shock protein C (PspC) family protein [Nocardioides sp. J9]|uniref:PspC domain-containing protein n=1 Tax=Nocardioides sp. J9 TaxID=935844 RepID=UPI0011A75F67|nr:PspC domain-containing protein [Nocardioides sp. J9]TWH04867.1 phage shock protein C (PspC) family protein [Nocardioides sp. J9]
MNAPHDTDTGQPGQPGDPGQPGPEPAAGPRVTREEVRDLARLRRSRTDRKVAGVAAGVARHLDIDPLLVRVAFVVLTFFGGGGLILYGVAWVLVPEDETGETVVRTDDGVRTAALIIAGVLALASVVGDSVGGMDFPWPLMLVGLVLLVVVGSKQARENRFGSGGDVPAGPGAAGPGAPGAGAPHGPTYENYRPVVPPVPPQPPRPPADPRRRGPLLFPFTLALVLLGLGVVGTMDLAGMDVPGSAYPATVLGLVGLMLLVGAFYGRAGGLILIGLVAAAVTAFGSAIGNASIGEVRHTPDTAAEVELSHDLGIGDMVIDLTELPADELAKLDGETLIVDTRVGHLRVVVPDAGLRVEVDADIAVGEIVLFGDKSESSDQATYGDVTDPTLTIEAEMFVGQIEVLTEEEAA